MTAARPRWPITRIGVALAVGAAALPAAAADAQRGAALYMRTDGDMRSCVSCHGPDPGQNHNNILRAADRPEALTKALSTVSAMGFIGSALSDPDRADLAAFLGTVARLNAPDPKLHVWPITFDFGSSAVATPSATQSLRVNNPSPSQAVSIGPIVASGAPMAIEHNCPDALAPGASCDIQVRLEPVAGLTRGAISIQTTASAMPVITGVSGRGIAGPVSSLVWQPVDASLHFKATSSASVTRTLSLFNPGPMPAVLGAVSVVGAGASRFKVESGCAPGSVVQVGATCQMVLSFVPNLLPAVQATLQLRSDQSNPASVLLAGNAAQPAAPGPVEAAAPVDAGGGCSAGPPDRRAFDPLLLAALLAARHRQR